MGRVNKNIRLKDIRRNPNMWVKHTYVGDGSKLDLYAVKCITDNDEYMSSPNWGFPSQSIMDNLNIEIEYSELTTISVGYLLGVQTENSFLYIRRLTSAISFSVRDDNNTIVTLGGVPNDIENGVVRVVNEFGTLKLYVNDIELDSEDISSIIWNFTNLQTEDVQFGARNSGLHPTIVFRSIKINDNEWTFPEGTGNTTTSSKGTVTTLHSSIPSVQCISDNNEYMSSPPDGAPGINLIETEYFQIDFTPASGVTLELTSIEFDVASRFTTRPVRKFSLAYSLSSDFSSPVFIATGVDISTTTISIPLNYNHTFGTAVEVSDTIYFRIYPYDAYNNLQPQIIVNKNTFFINGTIQGGSPTPSQLLSWPLDEEVNDSYDYFVYDLLEISSANYTLAGMIDDVGSPITSGGLWRYMPSGIWDYFISIHGEFVLWDINVEIEYSNLTTLTIQQETFQIVIDSSGVYVGSNTYLNSMPANGTVRIVGDGVLSAEVFVNNISIGSQTVTGNLASLGQFPLYFNADSTPTSNGNCVYKRILIGNHEWTFDEGTGDTTYSSLGAETTLHNSELQGIKCIVDNNEYMSSPAANYFPSLISELNIELEMVNFSPNVALNTLISQGNFTADSNLYLYYLSSSSQLILRVVSYDGTTQQNIFMTHDISLTDFQQIETIKVVGRSGFVDFIFDDVVVESGVIWFDVIEDISASPLYFNTGTNVDSPLSSFTSNSTYKRVKVQNEEWTFPEGSGSTTTSSEGTVTTLNGDVSAEAMWVFDNDTEGMWVFDTDTDHMWINLN